MMKRLAVLAWLVGGWGWLAPASWAGQEEQFPATWLADWSDPPCSLRPLPILHGVPPRQATPAVMARIKQAGMGGIVANVSFSDYLRSESNWRTLVEAVESCRQQGLVVWIYDEQGYPSGSAGGEVLRERPELEARALAFDPARADPFLLRVSYEFTHASNNYCASRRYPNLIEPAAVDLFVHKTHEAYWGRLEKEFGTTIRAFFTDEPSLMAVHLGSLGEEVRKTVRVADPTDDRVKILASVPWCDDLPAQYQRRYGQDLLTVRRSLFAGAAAEDRLVRVRFWQLVGDLMAERYFGRLQSWCGQHRVASSGHSLWEENPLHHVPLYGNALKALGRMDIPGMDMLSSDPMTVVYGGWQTATLPASAAMLNGRRQVMTEVSDFAQVMAKQPPVSLEMMRATAAWQAALGVTEFTSYYGSLRRAATESQAGDAGLVKSLSRPYGDFVGRLNAVLRSARQCPDVLLYYPIHDLWEEYLPVADRLDLKSQSARARQLVGSFQSLGYRMLVRQVPFAIIDHEMLSAGQVRDGGLWVGERRFGALVIPAGVQLPPPAAAVADKLAAAGGLVMRDGATPPVDIARLAQLRPSGRLLPACGEIVLGRFSRDGRDILVLVNVGGKDYAGRVSAEGGPWCLADPATGQTQGGLAPSQGSLDLKLPARGTVLLIGPAKAGT